MRICPACGVENADDRDFCTCGEYLRWEPTGYMPAIPAPAAPAQPQTPAAPALPGTPPAPAPPPAAAQPPPAPPMTPGGTQIRGAVPGPPQKAEPVAEATITFQAAEDVQVTGDGVAIGVDPGGRAVLRALVRNQSGIVDNYDLAVHGLPDGWATVSPPTVYLVPFGSGGSYEQEVEVHLHPPRSAQAEARVWELELVAHSKAREAPVALAPFALGVQPFEDHAISMSPERISARRRGTYEVEIANRANAVARIALAGSDPDGSFRFDFDPPVLELGPGRSATSKMTARPPRQIWLGRPHEHRLEVLTATGDEAEAKLAALAPDVQEKAKGGLLADAKSALGALPVTKPRVSMGSGGPNIQGPRLKRMVMPQVDLLKLKPPGSAPVAPVGPLMPTQVAFRQKPWLPWWLSVAVPILAGVALLLFLLIPKTVEVPNVVGKVSVFAAEEALTDAKLKLKAPVETMVDTKVPPGSVIQQTPKAGAKVEKDAQVSLQVAIGDGTVTVPKVVGLTHTEAEKVLREAKLALGQAQPQPPDPKGKILSQIPEAKQRVKEGTPVDVFQVDPSKVAKKDDKGKDKDKEKDGGGKPAKGAPVAIPAVAGGGAKEAGAAASEAGLVPKERRAFSDKPEGEVFGTDPPAGVKIPAGGTLTLLVSAGFPELAYDDGRNVGLIDGATAKKLPSIAAGPSREKDPTFSSDGKHVAFRGGDQIFLADRAKLDDPPRALTPDGQKFTDPSFSTAPDTKVLAVIQRKDDKYALCVGEVAGSKFDPSCRPAIGPQMGSVVRWAPNGKSIFVPSVDDEGRFGIRRFTSSTPFSADAGDWRGGRFVTDVSKPGRGVKDLAVSPDGKRMVAVSNLGTPGFRLSLAKFGDWKLSKAKPMGVEGCKATWRTDGLEIAVVQADQSCSQDVGTLRRFPVNDPKDQTSLKVGGDDPVYEPLSVGG